MSEASALAKRTTPGVASLRTLAQYVAGLSSIEDIDSAIVFAEVNLLENSHAVALDWETANELKVAAIDLWNLIERKREGALCSQSANIILTLLAHNACVALWMCFKQQSETAADLRRCIVALTEYWPSATGEVHSEIFRTSAKKLPEMVSDIYVSSLPNAAEECIEILIAISEMYWNFGNSLNASNHHSGEDKKAALDLILVACDCLKATSEGPSRDFCKI